jgi:hypothetical protein
MEAMKGSALNPRATLPKIVLDVEKRGGLVHELELKNAKKTHGMRGWQDEKLRSEKTSTQSAAVPAMNWVRRPYRSKKSPRAGVRTMGRICAIPLV